MEFLKIITLLLPYHADTLHKPQKYNTKSWRKHKKNCIKHEKVSIYLILCFLKFLYASYNKAWRMVGNWTIKVYFVIWSSSNTFKLKIVIHWTYLFNNGNRSGNIKNWTELTISVASPIKSSTFASNKFSRLLVRLEYSNWFGLPRTRIFTDTRKGVNWSNCKLNI